MPDEPRCPADAARDRHVMSRRPRDPFPDEDPREVLRRLYLAGGCEFVSVIARDELACALCAGLADRGYVPWELPELPIAGCVRTGGCRCAYEPAITVVE